MKLPKQKWHALASWTVGLGMPAIALTLLWGSLKLRPYLNLFTQEISVTSLARFANSGVLSDELAAYGAFPQLEILRPYLTAPLYGDPAAVPQLVDSPEGKILLERLGRLILTRDRHNGHAALRQGLITAAAQGELNLIQVFRQFPDAKIRVHGPELGRIAWSIGRGLQQKQAAIARLEREFRREQSAQSPTFRSLTSLVQPGSAIAWSTWLVEDPDRGRQIWVDVYQPEQQPQTPAPVVVISHGLTANRRTFLYLARYLASHGFLVVALEHPDSNGAAHQDFLAGKTATLLPPEALIERPRDVSFVLDVLTQAGLDRWFDLQQVGIVGHSLGGNTALALAGAQLDRQQLAQACPQTSTSLNLSLVFAQCPMLNLPTRKTQQNLRDPRIVSVVAINPVASQVFSAASLADLEVPLLVVASEQDWITPALEEQILPFQHLQSQASRPEPRPPRYLALLRGAQHWTAMGGQDCLRPGPRLSGPAQPSWEPMILGRRVARTGSALADEAVRQAQQLQRTETRAIARDYLCGLSTAFFETTLKAQPLQRYLSADYAATLSQPQLPLVFVQSQPRDRTGTTRIGTTRIGTTRSLDTPRAAKRGWGRG